MTKKPARKGRSYQSGGMEKNIDIENIRWSAVIVTGLLVIGLIFALVFGVRACAVRAGKDTPETEPQEHSSTEVVQSTLSAQQTENKGTMENPLDLSEAVIAVQSQEKSINTPDVFGHEMIYSAGTGSLLEPLLKTLYLYDLETDTETEVRKVKLKNGEIFQTVLNANYIAWLETDQRGKNAIYVPDRAQENAEPRLIKECSFAVPKLRLSQDFLIWIEQDEDKEEHLYVVDLISEENASIPGFAESIARMMSTYGVSAPGIYDTQVVWAASDPDQTEEDSLANGEKSAIYSCDITRFAEDAYEPSVYRAGMYVHDPITNGEAWAWIDKNKAPDSALYLRVGEGEAQKIAEGVITYALGDEMLIFGQKGNIYAYFYQEGTFARLNREGERSIMPVVSGRRVVWFGASEDNKDQLNYLYIPYPAESADESGLSAS